MGDIGTHAENLAEYVTGLRIVELCADLTTFVRGRRLDDDGNVLVRFQKGARGVLHASQVSVGEENALTLRVYGEEKGLEWRQEDPNTLRARLNDGPEIWSRGQGYVAAKSPAAERVTHLPAGHPEAFLGAFANVYRNAADTIRARLAGVKPDALALDFPDRRRRATRHAVHRGAAGERAVGPEVDAGAGAVTNECRWRRRPRWREGAGVLRGFAVAPRASRALARGRRARTSRATCLPAGQQSRGGRGQGSQVREFVSPPMHLPHVPSDL